MTALPYFNFSETQLSRLKKHIGFTLDQSKKQFSTTLFGLVISLTFLVSTTFAQKKFAADKLPFDEVAVRQELIQYGVPLSDVGGTLEYLREKSENKRLGITPKVTPNMPLGANDCYNNDFEDGTFTGWNGCTGCHPNFILPFGCTSGGVCTTPGLVAGRHTIVSGGGIDPCGGFPMVAPGGNFSCRLGNNSSGGEAEQLYRTFSVSASNTNFTYQFAVVLEVPTHSKSQQPYFEAVMFDQKGDTIPCSYYFVTAGEGIPGFQNSSSCNGVIYRPWASVYIDLSNYIGQNVTARFTTADCAMGAHFAYAYIDAACSQFEIKALPGCGNGAAILSAPAGAGKYLWSPGGDTTQTKTVNTAGNYCVTMTTVQGCVKQLCHNYVPGPPINLAAAFTTANAPCSKTVNLSDQTTISSDTIRSWKWYYGDGTSSSVKTPPTHNYAATGSYTITLIVTSGNGCTDTVVKPLVISAQPVASYSVNNACAGTQVNFNDLSTGTNLQNWTWNFGDGSTSNAPSETHTYLAPGTYTTSLIVEDASTCSDTLSRKIVILPLPNTNFTAPDVCLNDKTLFKGTSTITTGSITASVWDLGDGSSSSQSNPSHTYNAPGTYYVKLTAISSGGCLKDTTKAVVVNPLPAANFGSTNVCVGASTNFTDASTISLPDSVVNWKWLFGDGSPINFLQNPSHTFLTAGVFKSKLLVTSNHGCKDTIKQNVNVYALPSVAFTASDASGCAPLCVTFTDQSTVASGIIKSWVWDFGNGTSSTAGNPTACYNEAGNYAVTLTPTTGNGCSATFTKPGVVTVHARPTADFNFGPQPVTVIEPLIQFDDRSSSDVVQWNWYFGDGDSLIGTQKNPNHIFNSDQGKTYDTQLLVVNKYGCKDTVEYKVIIGDNWTIYVPNAFSPNYNDVNDLFFAKGINISQFELSIFDRWGDEIFRTDDINHGWDGKANKGRDFAQQDVYVWKIKFNDTTKNAHSMVGTVTVIK